MKRTFENVVPRELHDAPRRFIGDPHVSYLAGPHQLINGAQLLLQRHRLVGVFRIVDLGAAQEIRHVAVRPMDLVLFSLEYVCDFYFYFYFLFLF